MNPEKTKKLTELTDLFQANIKQYKSTSYDEANTRTDFIDKFFELLDWDVRNVNGYSETYREVVREDKVIIEGKPKAPDYSFRVGGHRKFFLEAKKPSINIKEDMVPAFQIRRYGYTAKLPLSILTDFEEFAIYDTRIKPDKNDKANVGRVFYCTFEEYKDKFSFIYNTFSKEAILKGSFDKYVEDNKVKKGTSEVDKEFLKLIEEWRENLAKNLALRNKEIDIFQLNHSVQILIDRIIFLRIAEDRNMEKYGNLLDCSKQDQVYERLDAYFLKANEKYNGGLFKPEAWISNLKIDDKVFQNTIKYLYYPESPYEFSILPIEILGNIYEQFLGKTIRLTSSHQAKIEEKEEVKKAGGVYYTPQFIVDYIVESTVGEKVKNLDLYNHPSLTILDPACGSGSFLVGSYTYLLEKYLESYTDPKRLNKCLKNGLIYQVSSNTYRLSIEVKQHILLRHIFGVDIDNQAVEVTKLSLLLKLMEDENSESADQLFKHSDLKILPDLSNNIKCGNSLISSDFYSQNELNLFATEEFRKVNTFDWETEGEFDKSKNLWLGRGFPEIFKNGGFDCVIGNPPYVRQEILGEEFKAYAKNKFKTYAGTADLYVYFIEKSLSLLNSTGVYSVIVANKWMRANYGESLRKFLKEKRIHEIVDFGDLPVFKGATTYPCILEISNQKPAKINVSNIKTLEFQSLREEVKRNHYKIEFKSLNDSGWSLSNQKETALLKKISQAATPLGEYVNGKIYYGIKTGLNEAFVIDEATKNRLIKEDPKSKEIIKPFLEGKDIKRYRTPEIRKWLILFPKGFTNSKKNKNKQYDIQKEFPAIFDHLNLYKKKAEARYDQGDFWWELRACDYYEEFEKEKIIIPAIAQRASYTIDKNGIFSNDKTNIIPGNDKYLLAILNSRLSDFFLHKIASTKQGGYYEYKPMYIEKIPILKIESINIRSKKSDQLISLVDQMLETQEKIQKSATENDQSLYQKKAQIIDQKINKLVYELYGLDEEEIQIVEGSVN
ncbi:Eco57I restriction-modification methylase domain-containing protein [Leptospira sp. 201903071]|uniref:Eco57I restriction-modification methylase domain-containing protein n=1 Tax=Leptospira ainazelensis TaxID=2810034 RepID=UPI001964B4AC|nr:TaqI-like C-terminal specificity domain-containing protein [Leptospira ainazelensis]MBM9499215.1 Eco57I restriction-modification methylase domain-containing protein [Leptospira ainazelensis]